MTQKPEPLPLYCNLCGDRIAEIRITATNMEGTLLDLIVVCRPCLKKFGKDLELQVGEK